MTFIIMLKEIDVHKTQIAQMGVEEGGAGTVATGDNQLLLNGAFAVWFEFILFSSLKLIFLCSGHVVMTKVWPHEELVVCTKNFSL